MRSIAFLGFLAVAATVFGTDQMHPHFVAVTGDHEFSGQMIVRPRQIADLEARGYNFAQASYIKQFSGMLAAGRAIQYRPQLDEYIVNVPPGSNEDKFAADMLVSGAYQYVEPNWRVFLADTPNDPLYPQQWHLPKIQANTGWDMFKGNSTVIVALTDTGIRQDHQDLVGALVSGYNAVSGTTQAAGGDVNDTNGHGTHTAGIAGAVGNNAIGVTGVCQHVKVMPIKVVTGGGGSSTIAILTGGAVWASDHGARVVSTSFSGFDSSSSVQTTGDYIKHTHQGLYCWAAGNDARNLTTDPPDVTVVGASDQNDARASFSAFGTAIDVFAPGVSILSTFAGSSSDYELDSGTSMATPCAAGVGAMIIMANPSLTGQQIEDILYHTCDNIGSSATFGWGRVNLNSALTYVYQNTQFSPSTATVTIGTLTGGGVAQLPTFDNQYLTANSVFGSQAGTSVQIQFDTTTTISSIGTMTLSYAGFASSAAVVQKTEMFDWTNNAWVIVDQRSAPSADTLMTVQPPSPNRFKDASGLMRARVTYTRQFAGPSNPTLQVSVDQLAFTTAP